MVRPLRRIAFHLLARNHILLALPHMVPLLRRPEHSARADESINWKRVEGMDRIWY